MEQSLQVMSKQERLENWTPRIMACRSSGMTVRAWCQENGLSGRSIKEGWQDIRFILLGGLSVEDYLSFRDIKEYFCTSCGAILNDQPGFNPEVGIWTCTECGMLLMDAETYGTKIVSGVAWYCDNCGELLNNQAGFSDVSGWWRYTTCGCINATTDADIINSDPDTLWPVT